MGKAGTDLSNDTSIKEASDRAIKVQISADTLDEIMSSPSSLKKLIEEQPFLLAACQ